MAGVLSQIAKIRGALTMDWQLVVFLLFMVVLPVGLIVVGLLFGLGWLAVAGVLAAIAGVCIMVRLVHSEIGGF
jgi:hypothetical protein